MLWCVFACSHFTCALIVQFSVKLFRIRTSWHIPSFHLCIHDLCSSDHCSDFSESSVDFSLMCWPCSSSPGVRFVPCSHLTCALIRFDCVIIDRPPWRRSCVWTIPWLWCAGVALGKPSRRLCSSSTFVAWSSAWSHGCFGRFVPWCSSPLVGGSPSTRRPHPSQFCQKLQTRPPRSFRPR